MKSSILISICIPAYKRVEFLHRVLDSVVIQQFQNFEVIVTDDSPDESVQTLCSEYSSKIPLTYYRNERPLGTPENWNEAIRRARGEWIKLMHDDDWFADQNSLQRFADAIEEHKSASFFYSAYTNFYEDGQMEPVFPGAFRRRLLKGKPVTLLSKNVIGPPSVILTRNDGNAFYDKTIKWLVDIDFYIKYLQSARPVYINRLLINVGLGSHQVTVDCARQRPVEIPENFYLLKKLGTKKLRNIFVYDAWWRLIRNLQITHVDDIRQAGYEGEVPPAILSMIRWQRQIGLTLLRKGFISKTLMFLHFLFNRHKTSSFKRD